MCSMNLFPLASIDSVRPVFMIVMGVFLMIVSWRLAKDAKGWTARLMVAGAVMLGLGYALLLPMYEAGKIERFHPAAHMHDPAGAMAWHAVKLVVMNTGWMIFGLGLSIHAGVFRLPATCKAAKPITVSGHESAA
jgi:hypothetical protein